jgi:phenylacetate-CoA ligase
VIAIRQPAGRLADAAVALRRSRELLARDAWPAERLRAYQSARLSELVGHAKAGSPFYRDLYRDVDTSEPVELAQLPVTDKATLMERFDVATTDPGLRLAEVERHLDELMGDELYRGRYRALATGGSSGRRGVFVADRDEWRHYLAGQLRINDYIGLGPRLSGRQRVATVAAPSPVHVTYRMSVSLDFGLHRILRLDCTSPLEQLVEPLNRHQPEVLYGYPSMLELLASEQLEGRLRIAPATIVSSGETHTDDVVEHVRKAWDVEWFQLYGTTEAPVLGAHCSHHNGLHLFEDMVLMEVVDERNRPISPGSPGERVLITNLVARTQPLIRYAISDLVTIDPQPCPCGRPFRLIAAVEGRSDDILRVPAADGTELAVHPLTLRSPMAAIAGVKQYRIVYDHPHLRVRAALAADASPDLARDRIETGLGQRLAAIGAGPLVLEVAFVDRIEDGRDLAGKLRVVESRTRA